MKPVFSERDIRQIEEMELTVEQVLEQLATYRRGFPPAKLIRPATLGDGIVALPEKEFEGLINKFNETASRGSVMKFVPASGAASRMFKLLISFNNGYKKIDIQEIEKEAEKGSREHQDLLKILHGIQKFAFYEDLQKVLAKRGISIEELIQQGQYKEIVNAIISPDGLNYANLPKGMIKFHKYPGDSRTAIEEHLVETAEYCRDRNNTARIHFTVSREHAAIVKKHIEDVRPLYERGRVTLIVDYSSQKPSTNFIAVDLENNPFRLPDGRLLFRPGGHGALLENLSNLGGDIVIIKNIDNVVPDRLKGETYKYKRILGGYLVALRETTFRYLELLESGNPGGELIEEISGFAREKLLVNLSGDFQGKKDEEKRKILFSILNRPIRVCGMVRNVGEPGGGPFWIKDSSGSISLQVVEASQVDKNSPQQVKIWQSATHFSPTDFLCSVRDYKGKPFDLLKYRDSTAGFIAYKSQDGRDLKSIELPGLWNGGMAYWNSIFVEVPIITFNPVKTILDLLRPEHLPE